MTWHNNGISQDEVVQNQFTAYVKRAVHNSRLKYLMQQSKQSSFELELNDFEETLADPKDYLQTYIEMYALRRALQMIRQQEREIVLEHIIEGKPFVEIAMERNMTYKAVTCLYYRIMKKLRDHIEGGEEL